MKNPCIFKRTVLLFCVLLFIISGSSSLAVSSPTDISKHWAKKEITSANNEGWAYLEKGKFSPDKSATREEAVWMLIGACKLVAVKDFDINQKADLKAYKDKPSAWAQSRMAIAIANNLIKGYSDKTIKPRANITRAEFSVLLSRKVTKDPPAGFHMFFYDILPDWAKDGIKKVYAQGIVKGYPNNTFGSNAPVTKAEALVMIKRWKDGLAKEAQEQASLSPIFKELLKIAERQEGNTSAKCFIEKDNKFRVDYYSEYNKYILSTRMMLKTEEEQKIYKNILKLFLPKGYEAAYQIVTEAIAERAKYNFGFEKKASLDNKDITCTIQSLGIVLEIKNSL